MSFWPGRGSKPPNSITTITITPMMIQSVLLLMGFSGSSLEADNYTTGGSAPRSPQPPPGDRQREIAVNPEVVTMFKLSFSPAFQ